MARRDPEHKRPEGETGLGVVCNRLFPFKADFPADLSDCLVMRPKPFRLVIWEPLRTKAPAPPKARPYCCYIQTVIFYHFPHITRPFSAWRDRGAELLRVSRPGGFVEWDRVTTRLACDDVVEFQGERFRCGGGNVLWRGRRWWMVRGARREAAQ